MSKDSEAATQKILAAAEDIDQAAANLAAVLKDGIARGLAQDIRDRVVQIFEACNFQDLTSQRVTKVMTALKDIDGDRDGDRERARRDRAGGRRAGRYRGRASKATAATPPSAISTSCSTAPS